jgi:hypothetical protein
MSENGFKILVVEDDASVRDAIANALRDEGYAVETADDGQQAMEKLALGTDLVLADLMMPKVDGRELLRWVMHNHPGTAVILMTKGPLFRGSSELEVRRGLVEADIVDAVIGLPSGLLAGTSIPSCILVLRRDRPKKRAGTCPRGPNAKDETAQGVRAMGGNLSEWTTPPVRSGKTGASARWAYGASWYAIDDGYAGAALGGMQMPAKRAETVGFRCVADPAAP